MCGMCGMQLMRDLRSQGLDMHGLECGQHSSMLGKVLTIVRWVFFIEGINKKRPTFFAVVILGYSDKKKIKFSSYTHMTNGLIIYGEILRISSDIN
jgi:hypothetical protein